jgi:hypothetical protein
VDIIPHTHSQAHAFKHTHTERERERERARERECVRERKERERGIQVLSYNLMKCATEFLLLHLKAKSSCGLYK